MKMGFKEAVDRSPCLGADRYRPGLRALGGYSDKVRCSNPRRFTGSVDLNEIFQDPQRDGSIFQGNMLTLFAP